MNNENGQQAAGQEGQTPTPTPESTPTATRASASVQPAVAQQQPVGSPAIVQQGKSVGEKKAYVALGIGGLAFFLSLFGYAVGLIFVILGFICGVQALKSSKRTMAIWGIVLNGLAFAINIVTIVVYIIEDV
jgi:hypothetical protein